MHKQFLGLGLVLATSLACSSWHPRKANRCALRH